jgi:hypothetical protein
VFMSERVNATNLVDFQVGISPPDAIGLRLVTGDGGNLTVRINRAAVGNLIFQMLARASSLPDQPDAPSIETPVLSAIGADIAVGPHGEPGLSIRLAGGLRLTIALNAVALADLQSKLAKLAQVRSSPSGPSH